MRAKILMICARSGVRASCGGNFTIFLLLISHPQVQFILARGNAIKSETIISYSATTRVTLYTERWESTLSLILWNHELFLHGFKRLPACRAFAFIISVFALPRSQKLCRIYSFRDFLNGTLPTTVLTNSALNFLKNTEQQRRKNDSWWDHIEEA